MMYGIAALAAGRMKKMVVKNHPDGFGISVFTKVDGFGDGLDVVKTLLSKRKVGAIPFAELNYCWSDSHSFGKSEIAKVKSEAKRSRPVIVSNPKVKFYIVVVTEHRLKESSWNAFKDVAAKELGDLPNVTIVNSPEKKGYFKNVLNVYHHELGGDAFNYDGANAFDADVESDKQAYAGKEYFVIWTPFCNGNRKVFNANSERQKDDYKERKLRVYWIQKEDYEAMAVLVKPKGKTYTNVKGLAYKSVSDRHSPKPSGKDCKPVVITPIKCRPSKVEFRLNGKVIAVSSGKTSYDEKKNGRVVKQLGWRYYFAKRGYQIAQVPCELWGDGELLAVINPAFRDFIFR